MSTILRVINEHEKLVDHVRHLAYQLDIIGDVANLIEEKTGMRTSAEYAPDEALAAICAELEEAVTKCLPYCDNCGQHSRFAHHEDYSVEHETGYVVGEWLTCNNCGSATDPVELERWQVAA